MVTSTNGTAGSTPTRTARGYLGHHLPTEERAALAAAHYDEGWPIVAPTLAQVAFAYRVSVAAVLQARNGHKRPEPTLAEHFANSSLAERIAAAKALGVDVVWDTMVLPLVGNGKAAE
jgi:hypothetical protein